MSQPLDPISARWRESSIAAAYARGRWRSRRARERDPRLISSWLRALDLPPNPQILDVPSGTGRLREALMSFGTRTAVDVSPAMVAEEGSGLVGSIAQLPFRDNSFDVVVICRLLHHLADSRERVRAISEGLRVSKGFVLASFWDRDSLHGWRGERTKRGKLAPDGRTRTRHSITKSQLFSELEACGARILGVRHSFRFVSQQAFVAVEKIPRPLHD